MTRVDPGFRYPGELPPPKKPDRLFLALVAVLTGLIMLGLAIMVAKTFGWMA
jgi:hypothetical protein